MYIKRLTCLIILLFSTQACITSRAYKLAQKSDDELSKLEEEAIMTQINIYHGFNRCGSDSMQRLKQEILRRHPDWDEKAKDAILKCEIYIGMHTKQVAASWGLPELAPSREKNVWTSFQNWQYITDRKTVSLSFENNKLANIQYFIR